MSFFLPYPHLPFLPDDFLFFIFYFIGWLWNCDSWFEVGVWVLRVHVKNWRGTTWDDLRIIPFKYIGLPPKNIQKAASFIHQPINTECYVRAGHCTERYQ